jgi:hypothetical protein
MSASGSAAFAPSAHLGNYRIVAMHYPLATAATRGNPHLQKVLVGRQRLAHELQSHPQLAPLVAHLLLAGHTHEPFPPIGELPNAARTASQPPLIAGQCQVVTGSLSQEVLPRPPLPAHAAWHDEMLYNNPYQCTLLRFYAMPATPDRLILERAIIAADDSAAFSLLPVARGSQATVQQMIIQL